MGLLLMATAGYDPREAVKFWERMQKLSSGGRRTPEFLSTHPSHETRIRDLINWMPQAMVLYKASGDREPPEKLHLD
jgi:predicted Zn-dependent protease